MKVIRNIDIVRSCALLRALKKSATVQFVIFIVVPIRCKIN